jgi:hypothetical protein
MSAREAVLQAHKALVNGGKLPYFERRGLSEATVKNAWIGYASGEFVYPCIARTGGLLAVHYKSEARDRKGKRSQRWDCYADDLPRKGHGKKPNDPAKVIPFGLETADTLEPGSLVVLCCGEEDALSLRQIGYRALSQPGAGLVEPVYARELAGSEVVVFYDAGEDREARKDGLKLVEAGTESVRVVEWPTDAENGADINGRLVEDSEGFEEWAAEMIGEARPVSGSGGGSFAKDRAGEPDRSGSGTRSGHSSNGSKPTEAPDGAELLDGLARFVRRFVVLTDAQAVLVALWIVHTYALDAADCTPYLSITSAELRSGKTRLLEVLALLVARPWLTGRVTPAVLVRKVAAETPALLLDESDAAFRGDREYAETLRGVLNAGFRRGGVASVCVGQGANLTYRDFPVFGAKAIAGIGNLPDTVADRSIPIELKRRRPSEAVERFRLRKVGPEALPLQSAAAAWAEAHLKALAEAEPELPDDLDDRAQDITEPLLAIAEEVGGEWPERARSAAIELLTGEHRQDAESLGIQLLRDIRKAFDAKKSEDRVATGKLLEQLLKPDDAPWRSLRGEPLDATKLARLLKPYRIRPEKLRDGSDTFRGYRRASFEDAWERYLPTTPKNPEHSEQPANRAGSDVPGNSGVPGSENEAEHENPHKHGDVPPVPPVPPNSGTSGGRRLTTEGVQEVRK